MPAGSAPIPRLDRVSGRDGRILWDLPLSEHPDQNNTGQDPSPAYGDVDGDGALDAALVLRGTPGGSRPDHELRVVSLRESRLLWSRRLAFKSSFMSSPQLAITDLDGDGRLGGLVTEQPADGEGEAFVVAALDGRSGEPLWTWKVGPPSDPRYQVPATFRVAHFDEGGRGTVCLGLNVLKGTPRIVTLDARGRQAASRDLPEDTNMFLRVADINGDGRDELVLASGGRIRALDLNLKEIWSSPSENNGRIEDILSSSAGRSGTVVISPALALDGTDGRSRWAGHSPHAWWWTLFKTSVLDLGDGARSPCS
jgi:hypothetical protein